MADASKEQVTQTLQSHASAIDALHERLAATAGVDKGRLQQAVDKYKGAYKTFHDDALGSMN